jgi:WhiB family transcriptional regulator, redox-sensing transcriptional regulator
LVSPEVLRVSVLDAEPFDVGSWLDRQDPSGRLPASLPGWYRRAACHDTPTEWWFAPGAGRGADDDQALACCEECPVREPCGDLALSEPIDHGTWGGMTEKARRAGRGRQDAA